MNFEALSKEFGRLSSNFLKLKKDFLHFSEVLEKKSKYLENSSFSSIISSNEHFHEISSHQIEVLSQLDELHNFFSQFEMYFKQVKKDYTKLSKNLDSSDGMNLSDIFEKMNKSYQIWYALRTKIIYLSKEQLEVSSELSVLGEVSDLILELFSLKFDGMDKKNIDEVLNYYYKNLVSIEFSKMKEKASQIYLCFFDLSLILSKNSPFVHKEDLIAYLSQKENLQNYFSFFEKAFEVGDYNLDFFSDILDFGSKSRYYSKYQNQITAYHNELLTSRMGISLDSNSENQSKGDLLSGEENKVKVEGELLDKEFEETYLIPSQNLVRFVERDLRQVNSPLEYKTQLVQLLSSMESLPLLQENEKVYSFLTSLTSQISKMEVNSDNFEELMSPQKRNLQQLSQVIYRISQKASVLPREKKSKYLKRKESQSSFFMRKKTLRY